MENYVSMYHTSLYYCSLHSCDYVSIYSSCVDKLNKLDKQVLLTQMSFAIHSASYSVQLYPIDQLQTLNSYLKIKRSSFPSFCLYRE